MRISPFTPLYFYRPGTGDGIMSDWVLDYSASDRILVQVFHAPAENIGRLTLRDECSGESFPLTWGTVSVNDDLKMSFYEITDLVVGIYTVSLGELVSNPFQILSDERGLENTVLVQCSQLDNKGRIDMMPVINGVRRFFDFRIAGGFYDKDWSFKVENEFFMTEKSDLVETYSFDITEKSLTIGSSAGVPVWVGDMLNRMFSCDTVYVDGTRYSRPDGALMEMLDANVDRDCFVFSQLLRESHYRKADVEFSERVCLRRASSYFRRTVNHFRKIKRL